MYDNTTNPQRAIKKRFTALNKSSGISRKWGIEGAEKYQLHPQTLYPWKNALEHRDQVLLIAKRPWVDPRMRKLESSF